MKDPVILEAEKQIRNLRIDFFKARTVGCNRRIRIRFWDARIKAALYTSAVLITSPKRDKAFILTNKQKKKKNHTELGLKIIERKEERVREKNKGKGVGGNFKGKGDRWALRRILKISSMLDRSSKREVPQVNHSIRLRFLRQKLSICLPLIKKIHIWILWEEYFQGGLCRKAQ